MNREAERKRLVEILKENCHCKGDDCTQCRSNGLCFTQREADHLLENNIVVLPCSIGETLWHLDYGLPKCFICPEKIVVQDIVVLKNIMYINCSGNITLLPEDIGKTVFLTREQAEKALEGKGE